MWMNRSSTVSLNVSASENETENPAIQFKAKEKRLPRQPFCFVSKGSALPDESGVHIVESAFIAFRNVDDACGQRL